MERRGFTPVPLVALGTVAAAAVLLVAGYGVPVGAGLIVGLVLGTAAGALGLLWLRAGPGRSIGAAGVTFDHQARTAPVELPSWVREGLRVAGVDASPLVRLVAVGRVVGAAAVEAELVSVELRATGGVASLVLRPQAPDVSGIGHFARVEVADDAATAYRAAGEVVSGGGPLAARLAIRFAPAPPATAARLTIRILELLDPFPGAPRRVAGPWEFEVDLRTA